MSRTKARDPVMATGRMAAGRRQYRVQVHQAPEGLVLTLEERSRGGKSGVEVDIVEANLFVKLMDAYGVAETSWERVGRRDVTLRIEHRMATICAGMWENTLGRLVRFRGRYQGELGEVVVAGPCLRALAAKIRLVLRQAVDPSRTPSEQVSNGLKAGPRQYRVEMSGSSRTLLLQEHHRGRRSEICLEWEEIPVVVGMLNTFTGIEVSVRREEQFGERRSPLVRESQRRPGIKADMWENRFGRVVRICRGRGGILIAGPYLRALTGLISRMACQESRSDGSHRCSLCRGNDSSDPLKGAPGH
jgi:hypothetical protein